MMKEWRQQWHIGTGGATDPDFPMGFVQIGPMTNDEGDNADSFLIRMGQTAGYGYAPNKRWPNAFMSTAFDLMVSAAAPLRILSVPLIMKRLHRTRPAPSASPAASTSSTSRQDVGTFSI